MGWCQAGRDASLSCIVAVSEDPRRRRDDKGGDDEREHRSVDRRMKEEKRAGCGANDQRDKHTALGCPLRWLGVCCWPYRGPGR